MYKLVIVLILVSLASIFSSEPASSINQEVDLKLHKKCIYPTVMISYERAAGGGSGFVVRSIKIGKKYHNVVISAAHIMITEHLNVSVPIYKNWSEIEKYESYPFFVFAKDSQKDLAIGGFISDTEMPTVDLIFDQSLYIGTKVFHVGYGMLDDARVDFGIITQPKTTRPEFVVKNIRTNCYTVFGDSGGPLFLNDGYKVIGVCHSIRGSEYGMLPNQSYYTPITSLKVWSSELNNFLDCVYNMTIPLPIIPFVKLKLQEFNYSVPTPPPEEENK